MNWMIACLITWALLLALAAADAFFMLPWVAHRAYETGRDDEKNGVPRITFVKLPARRGPDGGDAA